MDSFQEDIVSNAMLFVAGVLFMALRDLCKRVSHSDCRHDSDGWIWSLPTWRGDGGDVTHDQSAA